MLTTRRATILRLIEDHGMKVLRYCGVSVVNVILGLSTFVVCLNVFGFSPLMGNISAWAVSTGPAYLLSRYWVWERSGTSSVKAEIAPFWILALVSLSFSSVCVTIAGRLTESSLVLVGVQMASYGIVWVAKYLVLDQLMWRHTGESVVTETV